MEIKGFNTEARVLRSMTGFGEARHHDESWDVLVEIRSVNNRHFKLTARLSDPYGALEPEIERLLRSNIHRGTVQVFARIEKPFRPEDYRLNLVALNSYREQLKTIGDGNQASLESLLVLPGVVLETRLEESSVQEDWPRLRKILLEALERFQESRSKEGEVMARELAALAEQTRGHLSRIRDRGQDVVAAYGSRLRERVQGLLRDQGVSIDQDNLAREVAIFADRADISEELLRMEAHVEQFTLLVSSDESAGRRLEFVVQEMGREINTIGSKANDVAIAREVIELKGILEKVRELIQNIE